MKIRLGIGILLFCALAGTLVMFGGVADPVKLDSGQVSGTSGTTPDVRVFKGIPFAAPPVGNLRWHSPQRPAHWDGVRKSDQFGPVCVQPKGAGRLNVSVDMPDERFGAGVRHLHRLAGPQGQHAGMRLH